MEILMRLARAYHITSDEWLTWNQIHEILASAAGFNLSLCMCLRI